MTEVRDLRTGEIVATYSLSAKEAVVAAYRQLELQDYCWWNKNNNVPAVEEGHHSFVCGCFSARKE